MTSVDIYIFYFINSTLSNPVTDVIMPFITELKNVWWLYLILILGALYDKKKPLFSIFVFIVLLLAIGFCDWVNSIVLKDLFMRERPCKTLLNVHLLVPCGSGYSLPSTHAANNFTLTSIIFLTNSRFKNTCLIFASFIAISRVFVGVHYPFDVLVGASVGTIIGIVITMLVIKPSEKYFHRFLIRSK